MAMSAAKISALGALEAAEYWDTLSKRLFNCAIYVSGNVNDAEDLTQEALVALWKSISSDNDIEFEVGYASRVMRRQHPKDRSPTFAGEEVLSQLPGRAESSHDVLEKEEQKQILLNSIAALDSEFRVVMELVLKGMNNEEIGSILGITKFSAAMRKSRAMAKLRDSMVPSGKGSESADAPVTVPPS